MKKQKGEFTKEEALKYFNGVNDFFGFKKTEALKGVVKGVVETVNKWGWLYFDTIIPKRCAKKLSSNEDVRNILWLNAIFNSNYKEYDYLMFDYVGTFEAYRSNMPAAVHQREIQPERYSDLLRLYVFTHSPEIEESLSITLKLKKCGKVKLGDWFIDMLRNYSEENLSDIGNIEQAREALAKTKTKGRPSTDANCIIWGTYWLLSYYGIIKNNKVTKKFLVNLCEYLDFLGYTSGEDDLNKRCDSIRATISQMRSGKMKRPHFKKIEL